MTDIPLVTIGMTCFNAQDTIERAIQSALDQDYPNLEIVIVDDVSTDKSSQIIQNKINNLAHIRLISHPKNTGVAGAHNTIIQHAKGAFIAIFDDDDISLPERISMQYQRIIAYEKQFSTDMVLCHTARTQIFNDGRTRYEKTIGIKPSISPHGNAVVRRILLGDLGDHAQNIVGSCANCSRMARTKIFHDLNGFDKDMRRGEDTDFSIRFSLKGGHSVGIAQPLVTQTMTSGSDKKLKEEYKLEKKLINKYQNYLSNIGWYDFAISWLDVKYANYTESKAKFILLFFKILLKHPTKTIQKIIWTLPARDTRKSFKDWRKEIE